jgi:hypothetical protein
MSDSLATTTATSSGSGVHSNIHQRAHNHASMVTNGQGALISSIYVGINNISRTAAAQSCHLMALARALSSSQDNNAYCLSYERRLNNNVSLSQSTCTPRHPCFRIIHKLFKSINLLTILVEILLITVIIVFLLKIQSILLVKMRNHRCWMM